MNIITPGISFDLTVIIRKIMVTETSKFLFEFTEPGGKIYIGAISRGLITYTDEDLPATFPVLMINKSWAEKERAQVNVYHLPNGLNAAITEAYTALETSPTGDGSMTLAKVLNDISPRPTFELIYKGLIFCTAETVYYPYNPIEGDFETIEKAATIYKTR